MDYLFVRYKSCRRENEYLQGMKFKQPTLKRKFDQISPSRLQDYELPGIQPPSNQSFPFRAPLMQYLISHASPRRMQKLYFSCKYFFFKVRKPICHFLYLGNKVESKFFKQFMAVDDPESRNLKNVCLSNSIYVDTLDSKCLSNVIPKLSIISLNFFTLRHQNISVNEYFLLTKSLTTFAIKLDNVSIEDDEGCPIAFEDFFSTLSRAQIIELVSISFSTLERFPENEVANYRSPSELSVTSKTNDRISKIEKTSKFWTFKLNVTDKLFDLNLNNLFTFLYVSFFLLSQMLHGVIGHPESEKRSYSCFSTNLCFRNIAEYRQRYSLTSKKTQTKWLLFKIVSNLPIENFIFNTIYLHLELFTYFYEMTLGQQSFVHLFPDN